MHSYRYKSGSAAQQRATALFPVALADPSHPPSFGSSDVAIEFVSKHEGPHGGQYRLVEPSLLTSPFDFSLYRNSKINQVCGTKFADEFASWALDARSSLG
ncbi:hypothetical protein Rt10032_c17g5877 [Rhodotorula toruloides]|uniref:Uncharacterized protein n=1 Tax=Rhodotorula toruloides TaxID=5286 RepID=A0A511KNA2_RHOTO|nr:hypothetical protein Rt10032_c17g5877 [Rhodotorula toruloides]